MSKSFSYIGKTVNYFTTSDNLYFKVVDISSIIGVSRTTVRKMNDYKCLCDGELIKVNVAGRETNFKEMQCGYVSFKVVWFYTSCHLSEL